MSKYNKTYHLPWSNPSSDDKIADDITCLIGREIVITEKLDGENTGMKNEGVYARSHGTFTTSAWSREVRQLHLMKVKDNLDENTFIFGENMEGIHSIKYTNLDSYFYMFGIRDNLVWLSWDEIEEYSYLLGIPTVPVLFRGIVNSEKELRELVEGLVKYQSKLGGDIEGVVVRISDRFNDYDFKKSLQKWVRKNHVKTIDKHWTRNWKRATLKY